MTSTTTTATTWVAFDGNSSISSVDDYDADILTDRAGTMDDLSESQRKLHSSKEFSLPATVPERMSEDTLEDTLAFCDAAVRHLSSNNSRVSHVSGTSSNAGDGMLEPLDECDEGLEENSSLEGDDDDYFHPNQINPDQVDDFTVATVGPTTTVILTNMENLTLDAASSHVATRTGESSLQDEAPSQPTA